MTITIYINNKTNEIISDNTALKLYNEEFFTPLYNDSSAFDCFLNEFTRAMRDAELTDKVIEQLRNNEWYSRADAQAWEYFTRAWRAEELTNV